MVLSPGQSEDPAFVKLRVNALRLTYSGHLIYRVIHGEHQGPGGFAAIALLKHCRCHGKFGGTPSAITPGSAETNDLCFNDNGFEVRIGLEQIIGRPKPGISGAQDAHTGISGARQRGPGRKVVPRGLEPEAVLGVISHHQRTRSWRWSGRLKSAA